MTQPQEWFYTTKEGQVGPVDTAELRRLAAAGTLTRDDHIWREGLAEWSAASSIPGIFEEPEAPASDANPDAVNVDVADSSIPDARPVKVLPYQGGGVPIDVSPRSMHALGQTRLWVFIISILGFCLAGLCALVAIRMVAMEAMMGGGGGFAVIAVLVYGTLGAFVFFPAFFLLRYGRRIGTLKARGRLEDLEAALDAQKSFWQLTGLLAMLLIVIYVILMLVVAFGM